MWKFSLPTLVCMYLLQAILEASRASEVICSFSKQTRWTQDEKTSNLAFFLPTS